MLATEYCLFDLAWWPICMQKAEWASWVQAFGSIAAIGLAVWLQYRATTANERQANQLAVSFAVQTLLSLKTMHDVCVVEAFGDHDGAKEEIRDAHEIGKGLLIIPGIEKRLPLIFTLRSILLRALNEVAPAIGTEAWSTYCLRFQSYLGWAREVIEKDGIKVSSDIFETPIQGD